MTKRSRRRWMNLLLAAYLKESGSLKFDISFSFGQIGTEGVKRIIHEADRRGI